MKNKKESSASTFNDSLEAIDGATNGGKGNIQFLLKKNYNTTGLFKFLYLCSCRKHPVFGSLTITKKKSRM